MTTIPKILHYCWFGNEEKNQLIQRCMRSWDGKFDDYRLMVWDESNSPMQLPYIQVAYSQKRWSKVSNLVRLLALKKHGGIYLDTDVEVLRSFEPLLRFRAFLGLQLSEYQSFFDPCWANNAVLGSIAENPFIDKCIDRTLSVFLKHGIFEVSGKITTDTLRDLGLSECQPHLFDDVALLSKEKFYPYHWTERFERSALTPDAYSVHHWNFSWFNNI